MNMTAADINLLRNIILDSQHLLDRSEDSIERIVSDVCGLQYDPYPAIHLNQYMMLWNRKKDFTAEQLDNAAYKEFKVIEAWTFKRNMFFIPTNEFALYRAASSKIVRWGSSDEGWLRDTDTPQVCAAENELRASLSGASGMTPRQIWERLNLSYEWDKYRRGHDMNYNLPIFKAFYRMSRKRDLVVCGRIPGTFKEPVYILKENIGIEQWIDREADEEQALSWMTEKLIRSFGVTDPVHISHISGVAARDIAPVFAQLEADGKITPLPYKIGRKNYYIHTSAAQLLNKEPHKNSDEVRLISPMDTVVRDKAWLEAFFDYSFSFEYFKKKGMKWPLSILVGNRFTGYIDCKMDRKTNRLVVKEKNIFDKDFAAYKGIDNAIQALAEFHGASDIVEAE